MKYSNRPAERKSHRWPSKKYTNGRKRSQTPFGVIGRIEGAESLSGLFWRQRMCRAKFLGTPDKVATASSVKPMNRENHVDPKIPLQSEFPLSQTAWCSRCRRQTASIAVTGTSDSRCSRCGTLVGRHFDLETKARAGQAPNQGKPKSARKKASAKSSANSITEPHDEKSFRVDASHTRPGADSKISPARPKRQSTKKPTGETVSTEKLGTSWQRPPIADAFLDSRSDLLPSRATQPVRVGVFGVLLFLAGQALMMWAFFDGHFIAWTIGNLAFVTGLLISHWNHTANIVKLRSHLKQTYIELEQLRNQSSNSVTSTNAPSKNVPKPKTKNRTRKHAAHANK